MTCVFMMLIQNVYLLKNTLGQYTQKSVDRVGVLDVTRTSSY